MFVCNSPPGCGDVKGRKVQQKIYMSRITIVTYKDDGRCVCLCVMRKGTEIERDEQNLLSHRGEGI